jgi:hypothetical protein
MQSRVVDEAAAERLATKLVEDLTTSTAEPSNTEKDEER